MADIPCDILDEIKKNAAFEGLISEEIYNRSVKECEWLARRKRLDDIINQEPRDPYMQVVKKEKEQAIKLMPVFQQNGLADPSFAFRKLTSEELRHPNIEVIPKKYPELGYYDRERSAPSAESYKNGELVTVKKFSHFRKNFEIFSQIPTISALLSENILVMGGAVLACLLALPPHIEQLWESLELFQFFST